MQKTCASLNSQPIVWAVRCGMTYSHRIEKHHEGKIHVNQYLVYISCPETEDAMSRKREKMSGVADKWVWGGGVMRKDNTWPNGKEPWMRGLWKSDIIMLKLSDRRRPESIRNNLAYITSDSKEHFQVIQCHSKLSEIGYYWLIASF